MKNKILVIYGMIMLPILTVIQAFKKPKTRITLVNDEWENLGKKSGNWDMYLKNVVISVETREERLLGK